MQSKSKLGHFTHLWTPWETSVQIFMEKMYSRDTNIIRLVLPSVNLNFLTSVFCDLSWTLTIRLVRDGNRESPNINKFLLPVLNPGCFPALPTWNQNRAASQQRPGSHPKVFMATVMNHFPHYYQCKHLPPSPAKEPGLGEKKDKIRVGGDSFQVCVLFFRAKGDCLPEQICHIKFWLLEVKRRGHLHFARSKGEYIRIHSYINKRLYKDCHGKIYLKLAIIGGWGEKWEGGLLFIGLVHMHSLFKTEQFSF